jgi:hypothetical protein
MGIRCAIQIKGDDISVKRPMRIFAVLPRIGESIDIPEDGASWSGVRHIVIDVLHVPASADSIAHGAYITLFLEKVDE